MGISVLNFDLLGGGLKLLFSIWKNYTLCDMEPHNIRPQVLNFLRKVEIWTTLTDIGQLFTVSIFTLQPSSKEQSNIMPNRECRQNMFIQYMTVVPLVSHSFGIVVCRLAHQLNALFVHTEGGITTHDCIMLSETHLKSTSFTDVDPVYALPVCLSI